MLNQDPLDVNSKANAIVETIRKRKALKAGIPALDEYLDKF